MMQVYIVMKYEYIEGDMEYYTIPIILDVCLNKELAINLQKKYFLKFLQEEMPPITKESFERNKKRIEKFNGNTEDCTDDYQSWGVEVKEFTIKQAQEQK